MYILFCLEILHDCGGRLPLHLTCSPLHEIPTDCNLLFLFLKPPQSILSASLLILRHEVHVPKKREVDF